MIYVGITDFNNQRYIVEADTDSANDALKSVRDAIFRNEPIDCAIVHSNNNADVTVLFMGPVRLDVARD